MNNAEAAANNVASFLQDMVKFFEDIINFIKKWIGWNGEAPEDEDNWILQ